MTTRTDDKPDAAMDGSDGVMALRSGTAGAKRQSRRELEEQYAALFSYAPVGIARLNLDRRLEFVNDALCDILGYEPEDLIGRRLRDISFPQDNERTDAAVADLIASEARRTSIEKRFVRRDGSIVWTRMTMAILREGSGPPTHRIVVIEDIGARKQAEQALRDSEMRFRSLVELANDVYWEQDAEYRFVVTSDINESAGMIRDAVTGNRRWEMRNAVALSCSWEEHRAALDARKAFRNFEFRHQWRDGTMRYISANGEPVFDAEGNFTGYRGTARNITAQKRDEEALLRFRTALDESSDFVVLSEAESARILDINDAVCKALGYSREELLGKTIAFLVLGNSLETVQARRNESHVNKPGHRDQLRGIWCRKDGTTFEVEVMRQCIASPDGPIVVAIGRDLTDRLNAERAVQRQVLRQECISRIGRLALAGSDVAEFAIEQIQTGLGACVAVLLEIDEEKRLIVRAASQSAAARVGKELDVSPAVAGRIAALNNAAIQQNGDFNQIANGMSDSPAAGFLSVLACPVKLSGARQLVLAVFAREASAFSAEDVGFVDAIATVLSTAMQRRESEMRLAQLAQFDSLTGLANRSLLGDRLNQVIAQAVRQRWSVAVLFVDLDYFKLVNDTLGHARGDQLLVEAAQRLLSCVRDGDTVARISGDEFTIILANLTRAEDAAVVTQKVLDVLALPFRLGDREAAVSASIGISVFPGDGRDAGTLLTNADTAMYRAKETGRNSYCFFTADMNQRSLHRLGLASDLRHAIERKEFRLHYQPKVTLAEGTALCGMEALLRWQHPERGLVPPAEFISVLEETGLIMPVGEWVLRETCRQVRAWQDAGLATVPVAVNLSARQFREKQLHRLIEDCARTAAIETRFIDLEITESLLVENPAAARQVLEALREAGFRISVDDFGTGYSSLSYLTQFPLSALKIDQSFVRNISTDANAASIVRAIINMAKSLHLQTIAEGVENDAQAVFMRQMGCDQAQGYFFSRPLEPAAMQSWLAPAEHAA
jgi:diguanylate cyclase (GGDEF)-like protein/PAS domain S-box-containing protein